MKLSITASLEATSPKDQCVDCYGTVRYKITGPCILTKVYGSIVSGFLQKYIT